VRYNPPSAVENRFNDAKTNLSAKDPSQGAGPWLPSSNVHAGWPGDPPSTSTERPLPPSCPEEPAR